MKKIIMMLSFCFLLTVCSGCGKQPEPEISTRPPETTQAAPVETVATVPETVSTEPAEVTEATVPETTQPPQEDPARLIRENVSFRVEQVNVTKVLNDADDNTRTDFRSSRDLTLESETPFAALYFFWDTAPGNYTISWEGGSLEAGENDFLHDYVRLPQEVTAVTLHFQEESHIFLSGISLYTAGSAPEEVQQWLPPCEQADILVFPTHSDDDALFFGALISRYAIQEELTVQTAFMVKHDWKVRVHERLNGLWEMGIRHYPILGSMQDSGTHSMETVAHLHKNDDLKGWQVEQIRRFQPLVIVGHDLDGEYGNGQHKLNAHYLTETVEMAQDPAQYEETAQRYGVWAAPKLYLHLYEENGIILDVNTPMEKDVLGRTPFEVAEDAYAHHHSQHIFPFYVSQDDYESGMDCTRFGLYRSLVGPDTGADIMENIDPTQWR